MLDGLPEFGNYKDILKLGDSPDELLDLITSDGFHMHDQWQVQVQAQIQRRARVHPPHRRPDRRAGRAGPLGAPSTSPRRPSAWPTRAAGARIAVLPQGPQTIPYVPPN